MESKDAKTRLDAALMMASCSARLLGDICEAATAINHRTAVNSRMRKAPGDLSAITASELDDLVYMLSEQLGRAVGEARDIRDANREELGVSG